MTEMNIHLKELFLDKWREYFGKAELPIVFYYTDKETEKEPNTSQEDLDRCIICNLNTVREGNRLVYSASTPGCPGGKRYSGFIGKLRPDFEYFLSCGIPGKVEGERYKKSPELVKKYIENNPPFKAPAKYLIFKRWDKLVKSDMPLAVIFFATPDMLSGLFTLANYDFSDPNGVIAPMGSGCSSIISYPLAESRSDRPRCVLGMLDVSARKYIPDNMLTFTIPVKRFEEMLGNMDESFLITESWKAVKERIDR
jgi:uncharacterized protein (DUF169 family)